MDRTAREHCRIARRADGLSAHLTTIDDVVGLRRDAEHAEQDPSPEGVFRLLDDELVPFGVPATACSHWSSHRHSIVPPRHRGKPGPRSNAGGTHAARFSGVDATKDTGALPPRPPAAGEDEHWRGYPGEPEASSYGVPVGARYGLRFFIVVILAMLVAAVFMSTRGGG